jgi:hypothetical protein
MWAVAKLSWWWRAAPLPGIDLPTAAIACTIKINRGSLLYRRTLPLTLAFALP